MNPKEVIVKNRGLWALLLLISHVRLSSAKLNCPFHESVNITEAGFKDEQGNYHHNGIVYPPGHYHVVDYDYIIEGKELKQVASAEHIRGCVCAVMGKCIRICDPTDAKFYGFVKEPGSEDVNHVEDLSDNFPFVYGPLHCDKFNLDGTGEDNYTLTHDGFLEHYGDNHTRSTYCLTFNGSHTQANVCFLNTFVMESKFLFYPYAMCVSVPFLVVTFLVYGLIPELRNLHGKNLMSYVLCLTVAYTTMSVVQIKTNEIASKWYCAFIGYLTYTAFVSGFFWLNVLCFDIWWTFRGVRGVMGRDSQRRKFIMYSLYAWGCPLLILTWVILADHLSWVPDFLRPGVGLYTCFISVNKITMTLYLHLIMVLQLLSNITLFILTAYQIRKLQQETSKQISKGDSRKFNRMEADKDRFGLYLRLFIVMGVTWLAEVLSFALGLPEEYSYVTDILNSLHGFFIFFLFVWKPKIKALIVKRYRVAMGHQIPQSSHMFRSSTQTTVSNGYSRHSTGNNSHTMVMKTVKTPNQDKLLNGNEPNSVAEE